MKLRTIERLGLIAATRHQKVLDEVRRDYQFSKAVPS